MKPIAEFLSRVVLTLLVLALLWWAADAQLPAALDLVIIVGAELLVFPLVLFGRWLLDRRPSVDRAERTTTFVHFSLGFFLGVPLVRALTTVKAWPGPALPVPPGIGLALVWITGAACSLTVANLALKGLGAPFFVALSRKVAIDWLYAWTRNPMVLATLAFFVSLGVWFRSTLFILWVLLIFTPALLFFVKVFEERELEVRFGASYLEYKARTPMLIPRKPGR
jgi:protein-S-isoprenylcysteine O-methyltransferase Ste14